MTVMSMPFDPFGMDPEVLKDAPLFRELQRVMAASGGPVNWELARQTAIATAAEAGADPEPSEEDHRILDEAVRVAELRVADFTGMESPSKPPVVQAVRRTAWVASEIDATSGLLEPSARRMGEALERSMRERMPEELGAVAALLHQLGPLLQGSQIGQTFGYLARHVMGRYDIAVPHKDPAKLLFVVPNLAAFEKDWSLDPTELRTYVALHEVTHRLEFLRDWTAPHLAALIDDFLSTVTIDLSAIEERFSALDPSDPSSFQRALGGGHDDAALFGAVLDDEQRLKLGRVQAFMAAAEGYADHVARAIGTEMLGTWSKISEALLRYRETETADPVFARLLGIDVRRDQYEAGRRFCNEAVALTDEPTLARMWDSAEAMPGLAELEEPRLWLARTV